jgi:D-ribose pyranase
MKKTGILNNEISEVIASMGHMDMLTLCDAGLPIPDSVRRIDLAVVPGVPGFLQVAEAIEKELKVQQIIIASELREKNPEMDKKIKSIYPNIEVIYKLHKEFKEISSKSRAIIRTGECTPYANIILVSGVIF